MLVRRVVSSLVIFAFFGAAILQPQEAQAGVALASGGSNSASSSNASKGVAGGVLILGSAAVFAGGIAITVLAGIGTMGLGFLGLSIPMMLVISPVLLVFDEKGGDLQAELKFIEPGDRVQIEALLQQKAAEITDWSKVHIVQLDEKAVRSVLADEDVYSQQQVEKAVSVLCR